MIYKLFRSKDGIVSLVCGDNKIECIAQKDSGNTEVGEINADAYEDEDEIWPDVLEQMMAFQNEL